MWYLFVFIAALLAVVRLKRRPNTIAFFHPFCNSGGGGERVLWCAIRSMQTRYPSLSYVIYSGDVDATKEQILMKAKQRFGIEIEPANVEFVFLRLRRLVEASLYPRFTMLMQTLAGGALAVEAVLHLNPSVFIDSMGYPLSLPIFRWLAGSTVLAYVHYPTISCDMIEMVARRETAHNNAAGIAGNAFWSHAKLAYYRLFAGLYGLTGRAAHAVMVNGSWTQSHIGSLWATSSRLVFPPCDIEAFLAIPSAPAERILASEHRLIVLSIGQIRPEKNHRLQLEVLRATIDAFQAKGMDLEVELRIAGGCRHADDEARVASLKEYAQQLGVHSQVKWLLNIPYDDLLQQLSESLVSIHTMWNEHFGISVVEGMAAGSIMLAHNSGGPKMDIVVPGKDGAPVGFLADTRDEFVRKIEEIVSLLPRDRDRIRDAARIASRRFSEAEFERRWMEVVSPLLQAAAE